MNNFDELNDLVQRNTTMEIINSSQKHQDYVNRLNTGEFSVNSNNIGIKPRNFTSTHLENENRNIKDYIKAGVILFIGLAIMIGGFLWI